MCVDGQTDGWTDKPITIVPQPWTADLEPNENPALAR